MKDKEKGTNLPLIANAIVAIGCAIAIGIAFTGNSSLAFLTFAIAVAAFLWTRDLPNAERRLLQFGYNRRDIASLGLAAASLIIAWYFASMNNPNPVPIFSMISMLIIAFVDGNKARETLGKVRLYYIGNILWFDGLIIAGFSNFLPFSGGVNLWLSAIGGISFFIGLLLALTNEKAIRQYWQQQHNQPARLDTAKSDPFFAEQLKVDKVKEQR